MKRKKLVSVVLIEKGIAHLINVMSGELIKINLKNNINV